MILSLLQLRETKEGLTVHVIVSHAAAVVYYARRIEKKRRKPLIRLGILASSSVSWALQIEPRRATIHGKLLLFLK
jgi:hypothetical protein